MTDQLDDALECLRRTGAEVVKGLNREAPNHGPMAAEALAALGRADLAPSWARRYRGQLEALPGASSPVTAATWREALGAEGRLADWVAFFDQQLAETPWPEILDQWLRRLLPATVSAGRHGLIRTAHAVRALSRGSTPLRIEELGAALAYWCAYYRTLAEVPNLVGNLDVASAVARVPRIMRGQERREVPRKYIFAVSGDERLRAAIDAAAPPDSVDEAVSALTETGARLYLANRSRYPLVFLHSVTAPAALRLLLPHMDSGLQRLALAYFWQAEAAAIAAYGEDSDDVGEALEDLTTSWPEVVERSIEDDDPHSIKFVEACAREFRSRPSPVYLAAALDWSNRLRTTASWRAQRRRAAGIAMGG